MQDTSKESVESPVNVPVEDWGEASNNLQTMDRERKEGEDEVQGLEDKINKLKELLKISAEVKDAKGATEFLRDFRGLCSQTLENFEGSDFLMELSSQLHRNGVVGEERRIFEAAKMVMADGENAISRLVSEKLVEEQWKV